LKGKIRAFALEIGFDIVGFASVGEFERASYLVKWVEDGCHGDMGWMAAGVEKRKAIMKLMPEARSSIVVGLNCNHVDDSGGDDTLSGWVAHYAQGKDYHNVMGKMLRQLSSMICDQCGRDTINRWYVDTGPVLERELAARAGIGWQGKSTVIISKRFGAWLLLGEILTSAVIEPDSPAINRCGNCNRCIDVCPTGAITSERKMDPRKCIAYLTIELKGSIPEGYRNAVGDRVFGCDGCLVVCPWNRFAQESKTFKKFQRDDLARLDLMGIMKMNDAEFRKKFDQTPLKRLGLSRLKRNSAVVLGNLGDLRALEVLEAAVEEEDELVREHAIWAIAQILRKNGSVPVTG
jgi:epoxyqueuosine reductase